MMAALGLGFPVAFALPGAAILTIGLASLAGWLIAGDVKMFFAQDGPVEWLSAGVMNFRAIYYDFERDTLIAIPLFIFMGIMLQRSRIAEDLLMTMAGLFGPVPGGSWHFGCICGCVACRNNRYCWRDSCGDGADFPAVNDAE